MGQVATIKTPITQGQALGALLLAGCPQSALLMVAAQSAVETNAWGPKTGSGFNNFNFGNVTPSTNQIKAGISWMTQGVANMKYIAFDSPIDGARAMINWLQTRGLLQYATANDLPGYTARLAATCYLGCIGNTDPSRGVPVSQTDYNNYQAGIASWMKTLSSVTPQVPPGVAIPWTDVALIATGVTALAAGVLAFVRPEVFSRI